MSDALLCDPFWLPPDYVHAELTDRDKWERFLRPALERQRVSEGRTASIMRDDDAPGTVRNAQGEEVAPEVFLRTLAAAGVVSAAEVEEVIAKAKGAGDG